MRVLPLAGLTALLLTSFPAAADDRPPIDWKASGPVVAAVEKELEHLRALQKEEEAKTGLSSQSPAGGVAYLLLQGLAARSRPVAKPTAEDTKTFSLEPRGGAVRRLYDVSADTRLVEDDDLRVNKVGRYRVHTWILYRLKDGTWTHCGFGESVGTTAK